MHKTGALYQCFCPMWLSDDIFLMYGPLLELTKYNPSDITECLSPTKKWLSENGYNCHALWACSFFA